MQDTKNNETSTCKNLPVSPPVIDAHCHFIEANERQAFLPFASKYTIVTSSHSRGDFLETEKISAKFPEIKIKKTFGLHPEKVDLQNASFLESLLKDERIDGVGEAGYDLFTQKGKESLCAQHEAWRIQLELAAHYDVPVVVHARKGLEFLYRDVPLLKKLPAVIFHAFYWSLTEGESFLKKGVNAYFSFGKQLLNSNKKALRAAFALPLSSILLETDAPYGRLRGEEATPLSDILKVYHALSRLRGVESEEKFYNLCRSLETNFTRIFVG